LNNNKNNKNNNNNNKKKRNKKAKRKQGAKQGGHSSYTVGNKATTSLTPNAALQRQSLTCKPFFQCFLCFFSVNFSLSLSV
jgi:hypothetical protein